MPNLLKKLLVLVSISCTTSCSTEKLYTLAIDYERSRANLQKKSINLDTGDISYLDNNIKSDTAIVMLHGFGGDKDNWNRFSAELDQTKRIIIPDLPGHGESISAKTLDYSISHQSQILSKFLNTIGVNASHIIGNSMGGAIGIRYTDSHPDKVKTLSLISPMGVRQFKSEFDKIVHESTSNPMLNICTEQEFNNLLHLGMHEPPYIPGIFMDLLVSNKCARTDIETIVYNDIIQDAELSNIISHINTPTIIIWGKEDRVIHVNNSQIFHKLIKDSQLVIFNEFGHVPLLETPDKTAQVIEAHIDNNN